MQEAAHRTLFVVLASIHRVNFAADSAHVVSCESPSPPPVVVLRRQSYPDANTLECGAIRELLVVKGIYIHKRALLSA